MTWAFKTITISSKAMDVLSTSVTALRFLSLSDSPESSLHPVLFAGIGHHVHVYCQCDWEHPVINKPIFPASVSIHGFSSNSNANYVTAHAGRTVALLQLQISDERSLTDVQVVQLHHFEDWVWDICWLSPNSSLLAVACGHSKTWFGYPPDFTSFSCIQSEDAQLSWSSTIFGHHASNTFYTASGSSFGELLVLKLGAYEPLHSMALIHGQTISTYVRTRRPHRLNAHHGPVVRITVSPDARFMASVSVDRTVRVWCSSQSSNCPSCPPHGCYFPVLTHFGHLGRVWDVAFLPGATPTVASVAEDRTCRFWSGKRESLELDNYRDHSGNVWSVAVVDHAENNSITISTGGEDGVIKTRVLPRGQFLEDSNNTTSAENLSNSMTICSRLPDKLLNPRKCGASHGTDESGRTILMISSHSLLISTDFGRILLASWGSALKSSPTGKAEPLENVTWDEVFRDPNGTAFTPSSLISFGDVVCAGQVDGSVVVLQIPLKRRRRDSVEFTWKRFQGLGTDFGMVMGLFGVPELKETVHNVFVAAANGNLHHWHVQVCDRDSVQDGSNADADSMLCQKIATYAAHRNTKSALVTSVKYLMDKKLVIVGDRGGRLHIFQVPFGHPNADTPVCRAICWRSTHSDRVSHLLRLGRSEILSCGFDGRIVTWAINVSENNSAKTHLTVERSDHTLERMDTIVRAFLNVDKVDILIAGFRGAILSVWDLERRVERFRHDVGNWRRAHDLWCDSIGNISMAYWRAGQLFVITSKEKQESSFDRDLCEKGRSAAYRGGAEFHNGKANDVVWVGEDEVMSGGEDTKIRITRVNTQYNTFENVQRLNGHISSVNGLCVGRDHRLGASCGGADEVLFWVRSRQGLWRFGTKVKVSDTIGCNAHYVEGQSGSEAVMRVTSIAGGFKRAFSTDGCTIWVTGRSNGEVVELRCEGLGESWQVDGKLLGTLDHEAVLSVCCGDNGSRVVCGGSGGALKVWDEEGKLIFEINGAHEGGVNCLAIRDDTKNGTTVLSGGDDSQIKLWVERKQWRAVMSQGHHAAVTGIAWVERSDCLFVSGGADRRVCVWRISNERIHLTHRILTAVPDMGAIIARMSTSFLGVGRHDRVRVKTELHDDSNNDDVVEVVTCGLGLQAIRVRLHN